MSRHFLFYYYGKRGRASKRDFSFIISWSRFPSSNSWKRKWPWKWKWKWKLWRRIILERLWICLTFVMAIITCNYNPSLGSVHSSDICYFICVTSWFNNTLWERQWIYWFITIFFSFRTDILYFCSVLHQIHILSYDEMRCWNSSHPPQISSTVNRVYPAINLHWKRITLARLDASLMISNFWRSKSNSHFSD